MRKRILRPGQSDLDEKKTEAVLNCVPPWPPRPRIILEEDRVLDWATTDPWTTGFSEAIFQPHTAAASLDPRFGMWSWVVYVDSKRRQVAAPELRWNPRLPNSYFWGSGEDLPDGYMQYPSPDAGDGGQPHIPGEH